MQQIDATEAKNNFETLLDRVEQGEEILITRRGKPVARLLPAEPVFDRNKARQAAADIRARRVGVSLGGLKIKDLINEGRK